MLIAAHAWPTNGHLIADIAEHGRYLNEHHEVLDTTYGMGLFWKQWRPPLLVSNDVNPSKDADLHHDATALPMPDGWCDVVVFDPPYKLNGTERAFDDVDRYGVIEPQRWQDRMQVIADGTAEACRVARQWALVKVQDQVVSGAIRWQTDLVTDVAVAHGWTKVDQFHFLGGGRPQPNGRRQRHAYHRPSTLMVFGA